MNSLKMLCRKWSREIERNSELVICRKIKYGTNNNFTRYAPVDYASNYQLKALVLKIVRMKK